jgi:hypothetical protein
MPARLDVMPPEALLDGRPPHIRAIAEVLRQVVVRAQPDAIERVRPRWGLLGYDVPVGRRTAYFAWIWPEAMHVHLGFQWGIDMDDPEHQLHGRTKQVRWTTWDRVDALDRATQRRLAVLVREGARVAAMSRAERFAQRMDREERLSSGG